MQALQRQADLCEFDASLFNIKSSGVAGAVWKKACLKKRKTKTKQNKSKPNKKQTKKMKKTKQNKKQKIVCYELDNIYLSLYLIDMKRHHEQGNS